MVFVYSIWAPFTRLHILPSVGTLDYRTGCYMYVDPRAACRLFDGVNVAVIEKSPFAGTYQLVDSFRASGTQLFISVRAFYRGGKQGVLMLHCKKCLPRWFDFRHIAPKSPNLDPATG